MHAHDPVARVKGLLLHAKADVNLVLALWKDPTVAARRELLIEMDDAVIRIKVSLVFVRKLEIVYVSPCCLKVVAVDPALDEGLNGKVCPQDGCHASAVNH